MKKLFLITALLCPSLLFAANPSMQTATNIAGFVATNVAGIIATNVSGRVASNVTSAAFTAVGIGTNASAYLQAVGITAPNSVTRIASGFAAFEKSGLWTNLVDGQFLGTNVNTAGSSQVSIRCKYSTNYGSPTVLNYGIQFNGSSQYARFTNMVVPLTNTLCAIFSGNQTINHGIVGLQNATYGNAQAIYAYSGGYGILGYYWNGSTLLLSTLNAYPPSASYGPINETNHEEHFFATSMSNTTTWGSADACVQWITNTVPSGITSLPILTYGGVNESNPGTISDYVNCNVKGWLLFNRVLSPAELITVQTAARWFDFREENYLFAGDSKTTMIDANPIDNWPWQLMNSQINSNRYFYRNEAISGTQLSQWEGWFANLVTPWKSGGPVRRCNTFVNLGINDMIIGNDTTVNMISHMSNILIGLKTNSMQIVVMTLTPCTNFLGASLTAPQEIQRNDFNAWLRTNNTLYDRLIDLALAFPNSQTNAGAPGVPYFLDGLHPTTLMNTITANMAANHGNESYYWPAYAVNPNYNLSFTYAGDTNRPEFKIAPNGTLWNATNGQGQLYFRSNATWIVK